MDMFSPDFSKYVPPIHKEDSDLKSVEEWKSDMNALLIGQESFLSEDGTLDKFNHVLDDMFKVETDCTRFVIDTKAITDLGWERQMKQLQNLKKFTWPIEEEVEAWDKSTKPKKKKPTAIKLEAMEED